MQDSEVAYNCDLDLLFRTLSLFLDTGYVFGQIKQGSHRKYDSDYEIHPDKANTCNPMT